MDLTVHAGFDCEIRLALIRGDRVLMRVEVKAWGCIFFSRLCTICTVMV